MTSAPDLPTLTAARENRTAEARIKTTPTRLKGWHEAAKRRSLTLSTWGQLALDEIARQQLGRPTPGTDPALRVDPATEAENLLVEARPYAALIAHQLDQGAPYIWAPQWTPGDHPDAAFIRESTFAALLPAVCRLLTMSGHRVMVGHAGRELIPDLPAGCSGAWMIRPMTDDEAA